MLYALNNVEVMIFNTIGAEALNNVEVMIFNTLGAENAMLDLLDYKLYLHVLSTHHIPSHASTKNSEPSSSAAVSMSGRGEIICSTRGRDSFCL